MASGFSRELRGVASDGEGTVLVWAEWDLSASFEQPNQARLKSVRIDHEGNQSEIQDLNLGFAKLPDVAFAGNSKGYLLAWRGNPGSYAIRLDKMGTRIDTSPIVFSAEVSQPVITATDDTFYVELQQLTGYPADPLSYGGGVCLNVSFFYLLGKLTDPFLNTVLRQAFPIVARPNDELTPALAFNGANYLAVWSDNRSTLTPYANSNAVHGVFANRYGESISDAAAFGSPGTGTPAVASDGTNFCLVSAGLPNPSVTARIISSSGVAGPLIPMPVANFGGYMSHGIPAVSWNGQKYLVLWNDSRDSTSSGEGQATFRDHIYAAFVQNTTASASFPIGTNSNSEVFPCVASLNGNSLVVWVHGAPDEPVFARFVRANGQMDDPFALGATFSNFPITNEYKPAVASGPDGWLAVWPTRNGNGSDIVGARITSEGVLLDTTPIVICSAPGNQLNVSVAYSGNSYFVVWQDDRTPGVHQVFGARVSTQGVTFEPDGIPLTAPTVGYQRPVVGGDANEYFVLTERPVGSNTRLFTTYVSFDVPLINGFSRSDNESVLSFLAWPGLTYVLQTKDSIDGEWRDLNEPAIATTGIVRMNHSTTEPSGFYRIQLAP